MNLCPRQMSDGAESVKRVFCLQSWHNPSTILLGSSKGEENKMSQTRRPCPYMVLSFVCMYMYICMYVYVHIYIYIYIYVCGFICVEVCMYIFVYIHMYVCVLIFSCFLLFSINSKGNNINYNCSFFHLGMQRN